MSYIAGFDPSQSLTSAERLTTGRGFAAGALGVDRSGNEWIYVQAEAAIPQNNVVRVMASGNLAKPFPASGGVAGTGGAVKCFAVSASASIASGSYGWVMTKGTAAVKCSASATATYVPTAALLACASAQAGLVSNTATTTHYKLMGVSVITTTTASLTSQTIPIVFYHGITMTTADD